MIMLIKILPHLILLMVLSFSKILHAQDLEGILSSKNEMVRPIAHGKATNIGEESTWANLIHSVQQGASVLELDIRLTKAKHEGPLSAENCDYVVCHDPTFHRLSNNTFQTSPEKIAEIQKGYKKDVNSPRMKNPNLYDRTFNYSKEDIQSGKEKVYVYDSASNYYFKPIFIDDLLKAVSDVNFFNAPKHQGSKNYQDITFNKQSIALNASQRPLLYYFDLKEINQLGRNIEKISGWDTPMQELPMDKLIDHTKISLQCLSNKLKNYDRGHDKGFVAVRHPCVLNLLREVDKNMSYMISSDIPNIHTSTEDLVKELEEFEKPQVCEKCQKILSQKDFSPDFCSSLRDNLKKDKNNDCKKYRLVEIKYLHHFKDPKLHEAAKEHCWKFLFNEIEQTDATLFVDQKKMSIPQKEELEKLMGIAPDISKIKELEPELVSSLQSLTYAEKREKLEEISTNSKDNKNIDINKILLNYYGTDHNKAAIWEKIEAGILPKKEMAKIIEETVTAAKGSGFIQTNTLGPLVSYLKDREVRPELNSSKIMFLQDKYKVVKFQELKKGGQVLIHFDSSRFRLLCEPNCPFEVKDNKVQLSYRFLPEDKVHNLTFFQDQDITLAIPEKATQLVIWFKLLQLGCPKRISPSIPLDSLLESYDSNFGQNFKFEIK